MDLASIIILISIIVLCATRLPRPLPKLGF